MQLFAEKQFDSCHFGGVHRNRDPIRMLSLPAGPESWVAIIKKVSIRGPLPGNLIFSADYIFLVCHFSCYMFKLRILDHRSILG